MVRSKHNIDKGIQKLISANEKLPDSTELMVKLAGVLFQESGKPEDILTCQQLLDRAIEIDRHLIDAYLLKGKIQYR